MAYDFGGRSLTRDEVYSRTDSLRHDKPRKPPKNKRGVRLVNSTVLPAVEWPDPTLGKQKGNRKR